MTLVADEPRRRSPLVHEILGRSDYAIISEIVEPGSLVLDLGCGEAELLAWLVDNKQVRARGVEINPGKVQKAIARGVLAYQGDLEASLKDYPDQTFDYILLSQTLQQTARPLQVLREMLRVGRKIVVAFPNFGHWRVRWSHMVSGRSPRTPLFPYEWYNSPNIHFFTIEDFEELVRDQKWTIDKRIYLSGAREITVMPNLFGEVAVYLIRS